MIFSADINEELIEVILLGALGLLIAIAITPIYTTLAYRYKFWKTTSPGRYYRGKSGCL